MNPEKMLFDARAEHARLTAQILGVQRLIRVLEDMVNGVPQDDENRVITVVATEYPSPRDAVLAAIGTRPGVPLEPREVTAMVKELGIYNDTLKSGGTAYSTALSRLAEDDDSPVIRTGAGRYIFRPTPGQILNGEV